MPEKKVKKKVGKKEKKRVLRLVNVVVKREGTDEAIIKLIPDLFALSNDRQAVIKILMTKMGLSQEQAESYYQRAMAAEPKEK